MDRKDFNIILAALGFDYDNGIWSMSRGSFGCGARFMVSCETCKVGRRTWDTFHVSARRWGLDDLTGEEYEKVEHFECKTYFEVFKTVAAVL